MSGDWAGEGDCNYGADEVIIGPSCDPGEPASKYLEKKSKIDRIAWEAERQQRYQKGGHFK